MIVDDERVAYFVSSEIGAGLCPPYTCMGVEAEGEIIGGVIFNVFEAKDIHVTVAGSQWTKGFMEEVGRYVFHRLECERMTITTSQPKVVDFAIRLGGEIEGRLRNYYGKGHDAHVVGILASDYVPLKRLKVKRKGGILEKSKVQLDSTFCTLKENKGKTSEGTTGT